MELSDNGYEIRNINENLEVKCWDNSTLGEKCFAYPETFRFETKSKFYCVSNNSSYSIVQNCVFRCLNLRITQLLKLCCKRLVLQYRTKVPMDQNMQ